MANYCSNARTNYFRVTDEEKYKKLFSRLNCEYGLEDFTKCENGITYHGFGGCSVYYDSTDSGDCDGIDCFVEDLQEILPDNECFIYEEVGYEKLRYLVGFSIIATKHEVHSFDIDCLAKNKAKELLGKDFNTQTHY